MSCCIRCRTEKSIFSIFSKLFIKISITIPYFELNMRMYSSSFYRTHTDRLIGHVGFETAQTFVWVKRVYSIQFWKKRDALCKYSNHRKATSIRIQKPLPIDSSRVLLYMLWPETKNINFSVEVNLTCLR